MPIYAYRCADCGHTKDVLQKIADAPLTVCPSCGKASFSKQLTAAGFQLKGTGWYVTDFRNGGASKPASVGDKGNGKPAAADSAPAKSADSAGAAPATPVTPTPASTT